MPAVVVWQEDEIGEAVARRATRRRAARRWLQHDAADGDGELRGVPRRAVRPTIPTSTSTRPSPVLMLYTAAFARPAERCAAARTPRCSTQDLVIGDAAGDHQRLRVPELGPLFHIATFMTTLATFHFGGTNVFTRRVDAEELCRLIDAERCTGAFLMRPDDRPDARGQRRRQLRPKRLRTFAGKPEWNDDDHGRHQPWARQAGGLRPDRGDGHAHAQRVGRRRQGTSGRPSPMVQVRIVDPDGNEVPPGETGEIVARGPDRDDRLHEPPERRTPSARPAAGTTPTISAGASPTARSRFVGPQDPAHQVGGGEHLSGRGRGVPPASTRR